MSAEATQLRTGPAARAAGRWPAPVRARLGLEILAAYGPAYRRLRRNDLGEMVRHARSADRAFRPPPQDDAVVFARRLGRAVTRTLAPLPTDSRCLIRSLVLLRLLARRGLGGTLVIGVRSSHGFAAHAWIECEGVPVLPTGDFHPITRL